MTLARSGRGTALWVGVLVLTLLALALDSRARLASIETITEGTVGTPAPAVDPSSPSGYAGGQHRVILPAIDGYQWILQTERMLAGGGARIRTADYDDAPAGREVHWSEVMRWAAASFAALDRAAHPGESWGRALERVAPWTNTALLALLLLAVTPVLAWRLGAAAAGLFALGSVAVFPFYEYFVVGYFDHHGVATMGCVLAVIFLVAGGAGWTRPSEPAAVGGGEAGIELPTRAAARRWFAASAGCAAVSLWVNAATIVPVLVGIGLGALLGGWAVPRTGAAPRPAASYEPSLWRVWGWTGGALGAAFYLLEYFPSHLGLRLEVNHPLYALAWIGGGDLLARLGASARTARDRVWLTLDAVALAALPTIIAMGGERTFRLADPFLFDLHRRFIVEFLPLAGQLARMTPSVIAGRVSPLPLIALPLVAVLWPTDQTGARLWVWRGALAAGAAVALAFTHVVLVALAGAPSAFVGDALAGCALVLCARGGRPLAAPIRGASILALVPAALLLGLCFAQVRWVGVAAALGLAALVAAAGALRRDPGFDWSWPRRVVVAGLLAAVFVVAPAFYVPLPLDTSDPPQEAARDASWWLRRRVGGRPAVVFTTPNATTWMAYFGGFAGVGSLYWENLDGLRAATDLALAPTADSLRTLLAHRGVTHVVIYPWEQGFEQLRLARAEAEGGSSRAGFLPSLPEAMNAPAMVELPSWLAPLPYPAPDPGGLGHPSALVFEIVPDQSREIALVRLAQYYQAVGAPDRTEAALRASLASRPSAPAWALLAQLEAALGRRDELAAAVAGLRAELSTGASIDPGDRLNAAIALAVARDAAGSARELDRVLGEADEAVLRRLSPEALAILVQLAGQLGLDRAHPETMTLATGLLAPGMPR